MRLGVAAVAVAAGLVAACGGGDGTTLGPGQGQGYGQGTMGGDTTGNNSSSSGTGSNNNNSTGSNNNTGSGNNTSQPSAAPGSSGSAAHQYFVANVYPSIEGTCGGCHNNGTDGSPKFLVASDADTSYKNLDARGDIIVDPAQSLLIHQGSHDGSKAPALTSAQVTTITDWLTQEMQERAGQAAPVNVLSKIGSCLDQTKFNAIGFQNLRTTKRTTENANNCTGCDNAPCRTCHTGGDGGFYMAMGSSLDTTTFTETQTPQYVVKYIGLNGTAPVASDAIKTKSAATQTGAPYTHPMFTIPATMQTALDEFVSDAVTKYTNKQCGQ